MTTPDDRMLGMDAPVTLISEWAEAVWVDLPQPPTDDKDKQALALALLCLLDGEPGEAQDD